MARLTQIFIGLVMFSAVIVGLGLVIVQMKNTYSTSIPINTSFVNTLDKTGNLSGFTDKIEQNISSEPVSTTGSIETVTTKAFAIVRFAFDLPKIIGALLNDISIMLHIPLWVVNTLSVLIVGVIVFIIIGAVLRTFGNI